MARRGERSARRAWTLMAVAAAVGCAGREPPFLPQDEGLTASAQAPPPPRCDHALVAPEEGSASNLRGASHVVLGIRTMAHPWFVASTQALVTVALDEGALALYVHDAGDGSFRARVPIPDDFATRIDALDPAALDARYGAAMERGDPQAREPRSFDERDAERVRGAWRRAFLLAPEEEAVLTEAGALGADAAPLVTTRHDFSAELPHGLAPRTFTARCEGCLCAAGVAIDRGDRCLLRLSPHPLGEIALFVDPSEPKAFVLLAARAASPDTHALVQRWLVPLPREGSLQPIALVPPG